MNRQSDLVGKVFGRLKVIRRTGRKHGHVIWACECDCGKTVIVNSGHLNNGNTVSCGCKKIDNVVERNTKHGQSNNPLYGIWASMRKRCRDKNSRGYQYYGIRGIKVCERWNDFTLFLQDMGERPNGYTLERKNNDGNYEPSNCKWATRSEQLKNRRASISKHDRALIAQD